MRKDIRPFVVEVKRGTRRAPGAFPIVQEAQKGDFPAVQDFQSDALRRAEAVLFRASPDNLDAEGAPGKPQGRILEAIDNVSVAPILIEPEVRRRGRKPGSKNRPKPEFAAPAGSPKRRGRPPRNPIGNVRSLSPDSEAARAALDRFGGPQLGEMKKRGRGRPRKGEGVADLFESASKPVSSSVTGHTAGVSEPLPELNRRARVRAGERWKKRLRSYAALAFSRRSAKP